jgi:hypothetical protein
MKKNISIIGSALLAIILLSGCGSSSSDKSVKTSYIKIMESRNDLNNISSIDAVKSAIEDQLDSDMVEKIALSPKKYGAAILVEKESGSDIYLYGLEDPKNPKREYKIMSCDNNFKITNLSMKSGGILEYTLYNNNTSSSVEVTYNYFKAKEISRSSDNDSSNSISLQSKVENAIKDQHKDSYAWQLRQVVITPSKQGAIVETSTEAGSSLDLYGIENPNNPQYEYTIDIDDMGHAKFTDITMLGDGKIRYTTYNYSDRSRGDYVTVTYDYFHKKVISKDYKGESLSNIEKRLNESIENEKNSIQDDPSGGLPKITIKILGKTYDGKFITSITDQNGNRNRVYFGIFNEDELNYHDILKINPNSYKVLSYCYGDPGYEYGEYAKLISFENNIMTYKIRSYNSDKWDITKTYDYINKKIISTKYEGESLSSIEKRLNESIENEKNSIQDDPIGGLHKITIKILGKTYDGKFITSITDQNGNRKKVYFGIFNEDELNYNYIININSDSHKVLSYYHEDSGYQDGEIAEYISLNRNNSITYKVRNYDSDEWVVKTR